VDDRALDPVGSSGVSHDLRQWINEGLMTFYFLVVGLEAKRELDLGQLRERRRITLVVGAALGGMTVPIAIYLLFNAGGGGADGWGAAMSTDTAFALGALGCSPPARPACACGCSRGRWSTTSWR
jgi:Na+/H+ antiporter NhaA